MGSWLNWIKSTLFFKSLRDSHEEVKNSLRTEIVEVKGIIPLLMRQKNNQRWSPSDREELRRYLRRLSRLSPYFFFLVTPGSFLFLPFFVWWLRRRRRQCAFERNQQVIQQIIVENEIRDSNGITAQITVLEKTGKPVVPSIAQPETETTISKII
jgi:hypothetical protein